jgi:hypothetical protein
MPLTTVPRNWHRLSDFNFALSELGIPLGFLDPGRRGDLWSPLALGQGFNQFSPLPPNRLSLGDSGGEKQRGGTVVADFRISRFVLHSMSVGTKRELCESEASSPLTQTLSPTTENGLGERAEIYGNTDPGRPQRGRRSRAPAAGAALG